MDTWGYSTACIKLCPIWQLHPQLQSSLPKTAASEPLHFPVPNNAFSRRYTEGRFGRGTGSSCTPHTSPCSPRAGNPCRRGSFRGHQRTGGSRARQRASPHTADGEPSRAPLLTGCRTNPPLLALLSRPDELRRRTARPRGRHPIPSARPPAPHLMRRRGRGFAAALGPAAPARVPPASPRPVPAAAADGAELREEQVPPRRHARAAPPNLVPRQRGRRAAPLRGAAAPGAPAFTSGMVGMELSLRPARSRSAQPQPGRLCVKPTRRVERPTQHACGFSSSAPRLSSWNWRCFLCGYLFGCCDKTFLVENKVTALIINIMEKSKWKITILSWIMKT